MQMRVITLGASVGGLVFALAIAELGLRAVGFQPWSRVTRSNEPTMHEPDSVLGWVSKPGTFRYAGYAPDSDSITVTFLDDHTRFTGSNNAEPQAIISIFGGSVTQGFAINDDETWPFGLQQRFPTVKVENFGTVGWGTVQSLLAMTRRLERAPKPDVVIYGFIYGHTDRNVATRRWIENLTRSADRGHIRVPYVSLDRAGRLEWHAPMAMEVWPLADRLALVNLMQLARLDWRTRGREQQREKVMAALLQLMDRRCTTSGISCYVVSLFEDDRRPPAGLNLRWIDCRIGFTNELIVPGEGHPNGLANAQWARCIADALGTNFESRFHTKPD